jgi:hypothetical protein
MGVQDSASNRTKATGNGLFVLLSKALNSKIKHWMLAHR